MGALEALREVDFREFTATHVPAWAVFIVMSPLRLGLPQRQTRHGHRPQIQFLFFPTSRLPGGCFSTLDPCRRLIAPLQRSYIGMRKLDATLAQLPPHHHHQLTGPPGTHMRSPETATL